MGLSIADGRSELWLIRWTKEEDKLDRIERHTSEFDDGIGDEGLDRINDGVGEATTTMERVGMYASTNCNGTRS